MSTVPWASRAPKRGVRARPLMRWDSYSVVIVDDPQSQPPLGEIVVDLAEASIVMSKATQDICTTDGEFDAALSYCTAEARRYMEDAQRKGTQAMGKLTFSVSNSPAGMTTQAHRPEQPTDAMELLDADLRRLVLQAASLNVTATRVQIEAFTMTYVELQARFRQMEERMAGLDSLLSLAGHAVADAAA